MVEVLGHVDNMEELLAGADIVVLPTTYGEGVPRILLEAAASGLPIVATDWPGCKEIVVDGVNGLLVPPKDSRALVGAIERLISDPIASARMGAAGRERALAEFDQRLVIRATLDVSSELLPEFRTRV